MKRVSLPLLSLLLTSGCEDPLKHGQRLEEARVLGARVVSETGEASLTPGAGATVELLAAGPEGPVDARLAFEFCEAAASDRGVPYCARPAFAEGVVDSLSVPIPVSVPEDVPAGARLAFLGAACEAGNPVLDGAPLGWSCSAGREPLRLSFDAYTRTPSLDHHNPDLSGLLLEIGGVEIPLDDPRFRPSCAEGVASVPAHASQRVRWHLGESVREAGESLQVSHFSTAGHFERQLSFVDESEEPAGWLSWETPGADVPTKLYLVVRDGRGGVSWATASVCAR